MRLGSQTDNSGMLHCFRCRLLIASWQAVDVAVQLDAPEASLHEAATACLHSLQQQLQSKHLQHHQQPCSANAEPPSTDAAVEQVEQQQAQQQQDLVHEQQEGEQLPSKLDAVSDKLDKALQEHDSSRALHLELISTIAEPPSTDAAVEQLEQGQGLVHEQQEGEQLPSKLDAVSDRLDKALQEHDSSRALHLELISTIAEPPSTDAAVERLEQGQGLVHEQQEGEQLPSELDAVSDRLDKALQELQSERDSSKALHQQVADLQQQLAAICK